MSNEKRRVFDGKFKERAVALAKERKNVAQAARELEISGSLLRTWIAATETAEARGKGLAGALEEKQEIERLRKRLAEAEEELEIIKKATAYFARERLGRNTPGLKK
jgi:transposase-like protein